MEEEYTIVCPECFGELHFGGSYEQEDGSFSILFDCYSCHIMVRKLFLNDTNQEGYKIH